MHRIRRIFLVTLALAAVSASLIAGGAAASPQKCVIKLHVNVFGVKSPESNWALQGGLNAGSYATLRAVASGCRVGHIRGRWISGTTAAITPHQCGGGPAPCVWRVRSNRQRAAAFQAFPTSAGSAKGSNVVRVAWAGGCVVRGDWVNRPEGIGVPQTTWTIMAGGAAQESGGGNATGVATFTGHVLRIVWVASDQVTAGVYEWTSVRTARRDQAGSRSRDHLRESARPTRARSSDPPAGPPPVAQTTAGAAGKSAIAASARSRSSSGIA